MKKQIWKNSDSVVKLSDSKKLEHGVDIIVEREHKTRKMSATNETECNSDEPRGESATSQINDDLFKNNPSNIATIEMIRNMDGTVDKDEVVDITLKTLEMNVEAKFNGKVIAESTTKTMAHELESSGKQANTKNMKKTFEETESEDYEPEIPKREVQKNGNTIESTFDAVSVDCEQKFCECCKCSNCICGTEVSKSGPEVSKSEPEVSNSTEKFKEEEIIVTEIKDLYSTKIPKNIIPKLVEETIEVGRSSPSQKSITSAGSLEKSTTSTEVSFEELSQFSHESSCRCLPDLCRCRKPHWTFPKKVSTSQSSKKQGVYIWKEDECPCLHGMELYPSSEESDREKIYPSRISSKFTKLEICSYDTYQQTIVMVKPDAMIFTDVIKRALIYIGGLNIINERTIFLTPEQVSDIHSDEYCGNLHEPLFVLQMSRNPILVLSIGGLNAIEVVKSMVGPDKMIPDSWFFPDSIRRRIGFYSSIPEALHVSADIQKAANESRYFFPQSIIEPFPRNPHEVKDYCNKYINPVLNKGLAAVAISKPSDPVSFLAEWLLMHNPYRAFYEPKKVNMVPT